jgi:formylglycine-generating enzyme required for sulfatase activity
MKRNYIGASHVEPWRILAGDARTKAGSIDSDNTGIVLGFRLVHDSGDRVFRGGGWLLIEPVARVAHRFPEDPANAGNIGFRLARDEEAT